MNEASVEASGSGSRRDRNGVEHAMKVLVAFAYFFLSILAPIGLMALVALTAPEPYVLVEENLPDLRKGSGDWSRVLPNAGSWETFSVPGALAGVSGRQGGATVRVLVCAGKEEAGRVLKSYGEKVARAAGVHQSSGPGYKTYTIPEKGVAGRVERIDRVILHVESPDDAVIEGLLLDSGVVRANPRANWRTSLFRTGGYIPQLIFGILIYAALQLRIWNRVASWAARVPPRPGVVPVSESELRSRLLAINDADVPFQVQEKSAGKLEATWRLADAAWAGLATLNQVRELRVIQLRPDEKRKICRALDIGKSVRSTAHGLELGFSLWGFCCRGITFGQWEREVQYGFTFRDGRPRFEKVYEYKFSHEEIRKPIVEVITGSGWEYRPVLFISSILGG